MEPHPSMAFLAMDSVHGKATSWHSYVLNSPSPSIFLHIIIGWAKFKGRERESLGMRLLIVYIWNKV